MFSSKKSMGWSSSMHPLRKLLPPFLFLMAASFLGTVVFIIAEKVSLLDAIYMVVVTMSTHGISAAYKLSPAGKVLIMILTVAGILTVFYVAGQFIEIIMEGQIVGYRRRKRMEKKMAEMKNHYIICGYGRVGRQVAWDMIQSKVPFVIIDQNDFNDPDLSANEIPHLIGNIASNELLETAGIKRAKGLIACSDSDAGNVFVTLSARALNPHIYIVARAAQTETEDKLKMAGANKVISPYMIAGRRMAAMILKPAAVDYLDTVMRSEHVQLGIKEVPVDDNEKLIGKTIHGLGVREKAGATILAIRRSDGALDLQPIGNTKIERSDVLITLGTTEQLDLLDKLFK